VIPTYRRHATLKRLLPGYARQPGVLEIVLVDDGSPEPLTLDDLPPAPGSAPIRIVRHARTLGLPAARNTGIDAATGSLVLFGEDDVVLSEGHVEALLRERQRLGAALIAGRLVQQLADEDAPTALAQAERSGRPLFNRRLLTVDTSVLTEARELPCAHAIFMAPRDLLARERFSTRLGGPTFLREDQEMQLRLRRLGHRLWVTPAAWSLHLAKNTTAGGGTRTYASLAAQLASAGVNTWEVLRAYEAELTPFFGSMSPGEVRAAIAAYGALEAKNWLRSESPLLDRWARRLADPHRWTSRAGRD
jgi:GT2 family glycosyltransferase